MGLTDAPQQLNLTDVYPEGQPFLIRNAWVEGVVKTQFGDRTMAKIIAEPAEGGQGQEFAVWGSLCEQVQQIDEGDVPGVYKVVKDGKRWLFNAVEGAPVPEQTTPPQSVDEAELGVQPQPGDPAPTAAGGGEAPQEPIPPAGGAPPA